MLKRRNFFKKIGKNEKKKIEISVKRSTEKTQKNIMFTFLSLVTSIKDYVEVVHKLIETDVNFSLTSYYDFGSVFTFVVLGGKDMVQNFLSFHWFQNFWSIPTLVPDIASSLLSEISIFDGSFQNTQAFLESPFSYGNQNFFISCLEKFMIGFFNSAFLCFPTSISHVITLRRFVMQGLEAGFLSGLGTIVGNSLWIASILFGFRFVVIPWLSLDLFRFFLGFLLIVKYMWDSAHERKMVVEDFSKYKIFFLTFFLSFTEQTTLYPFIKNLSFGSDSTILETFPTENFAQFSFVHGSYILGLVLGSLSLLQFTCWFLENPAFQIYMWFISSFQIPKTLSSKFVNFLFLYATMFCAISNFSYFGLDYTLTNPFGFVHEDRLLEQKAFLETAFLNTKASDRNTRRNRGRHGRRERWKRRVRRYRTFDASMYDQGIYDLFSIEDLNYGFDRFWLRRKIRNHRVRFRFFPGPWMRSFKKQLSRPRLESFLGPRVEFFRILFEQAYHPEFHEFSTKKNLLKTKTQSKVFSPNFFANSQKNENSEKTLLNKSELSFQNSDNQNFISWNLQKNKKQRLLKEHSTFRKFVRKVQNRVKRAKIQDEIKNAKNLELSFENSKNVTKPISSKIWKSFAVRENRNFSSKDIGLNSVEKSSISPKSDENFLFQRFYNNLFLKNSKKSKNGNLEIGFSQNEMSQKDLKKHISKKDIFVQRYKMFLYSEKENSSALSKFSKKAERLEKMAGFSGKQNGILFSSELQKNQSNPIISEESSFSSSENGKSKNTQNFSPTLESLQNASQFRALTFLHPFQFSFQKEQALKRKFQFYGVKLFRNFGVENNAPYFRVLMKRFFYYYKPSLRWERTLRVATYRRARRKTSRIPRKLNVSKNSQVLAQIQDADASKKTISQFHGVSIGSGTTNPTHFYSLVDKRASRYRFQIYKDVLQHWYYSPLNRLFLKVDIDSFIRRQPNSYFLTTNDEKFLHLKRQLLSEYYETLRWYTSMEHYRTMKNQIGGTKSLSNRAYNQQFAGTFKKIRHLFNMSPSFRDTTVLKFDQPLYNEYKQSQNGTVFGDSVLHEEFFSDNFFFFDKNSKGQTELNKSANFLSLQAPQNFVNQSMTILRDYLKTAAPIRQQYIENLLKEKNSWDLAQFLLKGQKIRGTQPLANETDFLQQEKDSLFIENGSSKNSFSDINFDGLKDELWVSLLKKCQKKLYDQEALKNYVSLKKEKYEIQKQSHEKYLKKRFQRIRESVLEKPEMFSAKPGHEKKKIFSSNLSNSEQRKIKHFENFSGYPSSFQKAMKESILWEKNSLASSSFHTIDKLFGSDRFANRGEKFFLEKTNIRKNQFPMYSSFVEKNENASSENFQQKESTKITSSKFRSRIFAKNFRISLKNQVLALLESEKTLHKKFEYSLKKSPFFIPQILESWFEKTKIKIWEILRFKNIFSFHKNSQQSFLTLQNEVFATKKSFAFLFSKNKGNLLTSNETHDFDFWKKRENIVAKRKKFRKTLKRLRNQKTSEEKIFFENSDFFIPFSSAPSSTNENRQKRDQEELVFLTKQKSTRSQSWKKYIENDKQKNIGGFFPSAEKKFQRRRSRLRRYSSFKGRGPIKKRTLREKFKRQFKSLKKYGRNQRNFASEEMKRERETKKVELIQYITQRKYESEGRFVKREQKQRRTRQTKHRTWKKKKQNFAQKRRKLRKRRRSTVSKMRIFNKKISRILSRKEIQTWWWKTFFPHFQKTTEKTWQLQKNSQIRKQLFELSEKEIFERDTQNFQNNFSSDQNLSSLQIGNKDFKPFAIPEALRIRKKLMQENNLRFDKSFIENQKSHQHIQPSTHEKAEKMELSSGNIQKSNIFTNMKNLLLNEQTKTENLFKSPFFAPTNPLPFYAGWDESLRKFVVTNRFLSRKECFSRLENFSFFRNQEKQNFEYLQSPLQGMNAATTLYWQIPFTTYDPDQFFALGMDGFSPIGWRNFSLNHSKQTTKPLLVQNFFSFHENFQNFPKNVLVKIFQQNFQNSKGTRNFFVQQGTQKNELGKNFGYRRILKKQKRLKKHPRPPVWFPSGSLSQQVLPVHYIYVFYKRSRLPRDRYIRRRLRSTFLNSENSLEAGGFTDRSQMVDFTLRKRTKPRRKYHRKRFGDLSEKNQFFARRGKFRGFENETETTRPSSKMFQSSSLLGTKQEKRIFQSKTRRKIQDSKQQSENLRVRQLRRRVQRQVYRPIWRSRPRAGGFVWPGDYLRLEFVKASPLKSTTGSLENDTLSQESSQNSSRKIRKKTRRTLQEWQVQPKKYLFEKHNCKVFKTRIEKSLNLNNS